MQKARLEYASTSVRMMPTVEETTNVAAMDVAQSVLLLNLVSSLIVLPLLELSQQLQKLNQLTAVVAEKRQALKACREAHGDTQKLLEGAKTKLDLQNLAEWQGKEVIQELYI